MQYLLLFMIVLGVNLLPAFGPPTWSLLVFARLTWHLQPVAIVVVGAVAAMLGRYLLASGTRRFRGHLRPERRTNLQAASDLLFARAGRAWAVLAVFVVSPLPSAQLFVAAGLLDVALVPLTLAFFVGRLVSYSFYVTLATLADKQLGSVLRNVLGSPWSIALQVGLLAVAAALPFVHWSKILDAQRQRHHGGRDGGEPPRDPPTGTG
jgi:membrane protein YqaA with SNARE-associated domain